MYNGTAIHNNSVLTLENITNIWATTITASWM